MVNLGIVQAMLKPETYDEPVESVRMLQTHISWVFLTGKYAYKVKKPVRFSFLDYSTLAKRKYYCHKELRVNRRLCPDIYLEIVPIKKSGHGLKIKGQGQTIEYGVKMVELPQSKMMSALLRRNEVKKSQVDKIAEILANFHKKTRTYKGKRYGSFRAVMRNCAQNFDETRHLRGKLITAKIFDNVESKTIGFLKENKKIFAQRLNQGYVRECHGDVHSENIFILDKKIYIFDAIEFNPGFVFHDVAAEVGYLAMDLDVHGREDLAELFTKRYVQYSGDDGLLRPLPLYKSYRAMVRAKVAGFKLMDKNIKKSEKLVARRNFRKYILLANSYLG
jgi:hypothetical protein